MNTQLFKSSLPLFISYLDQIAYFIDNLLTRNPQKLTLKINELEQDLQKSVKGVLVGPAHLNPVGFNIFFHYYPQ
jgi:hypothetical protein